MRIESLLPFLFVSMEAFKGKLYHMKTIIESPLSSLIYIYLYHERFIYPLPLKGKSTFNNIDLCLRVFGFLFNSN